MTKKAKRINTENYELSVVQNNLGNTLDLLTTNPLSNGQLIEDVALVSGDTDVNHKLGRKPLGWIITRKNGAADIYDKQDTNSLDNLTLKLNSSAVVTVSLFIF